MPEDPVEPDPDDPPGPQESDPSLSPEGEALPDAEDSDASDDDVYYEDDDGFEMDYAAAELFFTLPHWGREAMRNMLMFRPDEYDGLTSPVDYFNDIHSAVLGRLESARAYAETVIPADLDPATRAGQINMMVLNEQSAITSEIVYLPGSDDDDDDHFGTDFDVLARNLYRSDSSLVPDEDEEDIGDFYERGYSEED
ncbi:MAG: hypothetical protein ACYCST_04485 [Acidimicrobiales bacterium]